MAKFVLARLFIFITLIFGNIQVSAVSPTAAILVTTTGDVIADDGQCSLREAVIAANTNSAFSNCTSGSGVDIISFDSSIPLPATITLTLTGANEDDAQTGDLDIKESLTINGFAPGDITIDGNLTDRVFEIHVGAGTPQDPVTLNNLTIQNGDPGSGAEGGAILVKLTARLTINNGQISNNAATTCPSYCGGGIKVYGLLNMQNSSVSNNQGGGVHNNAGLLIFNNVQVSDNSGGYGIAVYSQGVMTFSGGNISNNDGGGIYIKDSSAPTLSNLTIDSNISGGGIRNEAFSASSSFALSNSSVISNTATSGAGILNTGVNSTATIQDTRISYNIATAAGGGINNNGFLTLNRSTIDHNQALSGGGIDHSGSTLQLTNDTISQNTVSDNGGGLYNRTSASMLNLTIYGNSASGPNTGGNVYNDAASLAIKNTIIAGAGAGGNCTNDQGVITSQGHNLESTNTCEFNAPGDIVDTDPVLGPLQDNGGATHTQALLSGSPAINAGDNSGCPSTDQRGISRPQGAACDIGSYELIFGGEADLSLSKVDAVDPVTVGDNITYTLTVSNSGPDTAQNVALNDTLPGSVVFVSATPGQGTCSEVGGVVSCSLGDLQNGGGTTVEIVVTTTVPGTLTNIASVSADTADPNPGDNSDSETTNVNPLPVPQADLSLSKVDAVDPVTVGDDITYTLTVSNSGPDTAQNVALSDTLPGSVIFVSVAPGQGSCSEVGGIVTCSLGDLQNGGGTTVEIVVTTATEGLLTNSASVSADTADPNPGDNSDSETTIVNPLPVPQADLSLSKVDAVDPVTVGDDITYTLTVSNSGPDAAQNMVLSDTLPGLVIFVSATPGQGSCSEVGGIVTCNFGDLQNGSGTTVEIVVTTTTEGLLTNSASVSADTTDPNPGDNSDSETTIVNPLPVPQADLSLSKVDAVDPVLVGDNITYTLTVSNSGPDTAQNVALSDILPGSVIFVSATPGQGSCSEVGGVVSCSLGDLQNGGSTTVEIVATTTAPDTLTNSASVSADTADPNPEDNSDSETTKVNPLEPELLSEIFLPLILKSSG